MDQFHKHDEHCQHQPWDLHQQKAQHPYVGRQLLSVIKGCYQINLRFLMYQRISITNNQYHRSKGMEMNMSMCLYWSKECYFVLEQLESKTVGTFILGCFVSALMAFVSMASKQLKQLIILRFGGEKGLEAVGGTERLNQSHDQNEYRSGSDVALKLWLCVYYFYYSLMHILIMLLIMTMNGFVILSMVLGMTLGYVLFEQKERKMDNLAEELPVNCGACS